MSRKKAKRNICSVHHDIRGLAEELEEEFKEFVSKKALRKVREIQKLADEALEYGQSMENRLHEYRDGIENIGFGRRKKR